MFLPRFWIFEIKGGNLIVPPMGDVVKKKKIERMKGAPLLHNKFN